MGNCTCLRELPKDERLESLEMEHHPPYSDRPSTTDTVFPSRSLDLLQIIRIQAVLRGYSQRRLARSLPYVHSQLRSEGTTQTFTGSVSDYATPATRAAEQRHGPFDFSRPSREEVALERRGPVRLDNGAIYTGEWHLGQRQGRGTQVWPDGAKYEGYWSKDQCSGFGRLIHADGDVYVGEWSEDMMNGQGTYYHSDGAKYVGAWRQDKQHVFGVETWPDGARYQGHY